MDRGWWSVHLVTAFVLVLLFFIVWFNWDVIRDAFRSRPYGKPMRGWARSLVNHELRPDKREDVKHE